MTSRRWLAVVALLVGAATAVGVPATWWMQRAAPELATAGRLPASLSTLDVADEPEAPPVPTVAVQRGAAPMSAVRPLAVTVPRLGLRAAVDPVGVNGDGAVQIPEDVRRVGWYRFSASPTDSSGAVALVGHRDSRTQGAGVFAGLSDARPGDTVRLALSDGSVQPYRVVERRLYHKQALPQRLVFDRKGPHRLVLVTCGGPYDRGLGGYRDNLVVTAVPAW